MGIIRGGNKFGVKWNKGGSMARGKAWGIDYSQFVDFAERMETINMNVQKEFDIAMKQTAKTITEDTEAAMAPSYLPAHGKYSHGKTIESIARKDDVEWSGNFGSINIGFDYSQVGAGGFLIKGTPKMAPDRKLEEIYVRKKYMNQRCKEIGEFFQKEIAAAYAGRS